MEEVKKPFYKKWWLIVVILVIIVGVVYGGKAKDKPKDSADTTVSVIDATDGTSSTASTESKDDSSSEKTTDTSTDTKTQDGNKVTYDQFMSIELGMSYNDVVAILGEGEEATSSEVDGVKAILYQWNGEGKANMDVIVENDVVTGKDQVALKDMDAQITMDKYNQIEEGMSYDDVKAILGEGQVISQNKLADSVSILYEYSNKDGSYADFEFDETGMSLKAQNELK